MEGRTKLNYGNKHGLITIKDIHYMFSIINANISDEEKAIQLYSFCNDSNLINNIKLYDYLELEEINQLKKILEIYRIYEQKGLFKQLKNIYKCTLEEIALRLQKINLLNEKFSSNESDYKKIDFFLKLFASPEEFRKSYTLFIKFGKKDKRLDSAREALNNYEYLYNKLRVYELDGIIDDVRYLMSIENYQKNYSYAKFVIEYYINSSNSYKETDFFSTLGIDKDIFNYCIETIEYLDKDLYNKFLMKKEENRKTRCLKISETLTNLAYGIKNNELPNGTPFDLLEFIKRIPFKKSKNFVNELVTFLERNNPQDKDIIINYLYLNKLHLPSALAPLDIKDIYTTKNIINGKELTNEDKNNIINYLKVNNIPLVNRAYSFAKMKYLNGEIDLETTKQVAILLKKKEITLIPSK